ncbi:MAG: hypothetical protein RIR26_1748 [Pseudomonadota bacterium]|jgi:hypothetical protein
MSLYNRRQMLRNAILGGLGYGALSGLNKYGLTSALDRWYAELLRSRPWSEGMDALTVLQDALQGGPSMLFVNQAMAQGAPKVAFLDIFMSTSADVRNYLNLSSFGNDNDPTKTLSFGTQNTWVTSNLTQTDTRFGDSKVNKFFTELILTGHYRMTDGGTQQTLSGFENMVSPVGSPIDPQRIAFASFVSYAGTGVHREGATAEGSIAHLIQMNSRMSPMGVAAFGDVSVVGSGNTTLASGKKSDQFVGVMDQLISQSYVDKTGRKDANRTFPFDALNGNAEAVALREQWLANLAKIRDEVASLKTTFGGSTPLGGRTFNAYGTMSVDRAASIAVATQLATSGLGTVSSVGLRSFDFHAPDANRMPSGGNGNMITCAIEAGIGINVYAKALIAAGMDGVIFVRTCSGRSANWVNDSSTVSGVAIFVKGSGGGIINSMANAYYGPDRANAFVESTTMSWSDGVLGLPSGAKNANIIDGTLAQLVVNAVGAELSVSPSATLGKLKRS